MASEACPVCCLILNAETPARVTLVAKPARRLAYALGYGLMRWTREQGPLHPFEFLNPTKYLHVRTAAVAAVD
jgi:hypothetical protein